MSLRSIDWFSEEGRRVRRYYYLDTDSQRLPSVEFVHVENLFGRDTIPVLEPAPTPVPTPAPTPAPVASTWQPRCGDVVRMIRNTTRAESSGVEIRAGQVAIFESHWATWCTRPSVCHGAVTVLVPRMNPFTHDEEMSEEYQQVTCASFVPVEAVPGDNVRCDISSHNAYGEVAHRMSSACVNPVRTTSYEERPVDLCAESFRAAWADDLERRQEERDWALAQVGPIRPGERYRLTGNRGTLSYYGCIATVIEAAANGSILCDIDDDQGVTIRRRFYVSVFAFGERIHPWHAARMVPGYIRFPAVPVFSGPSRSTDREVTLADDDHECGSECFEQGCIDTREIEDVTNDSCRCYGCRQGGLVEETLSNGVEIYSYNYTPQLVFSGDGPVYLGTELELSTGNSTRNMRNAAQLLHDSSIGSLVYLKGDGSIRGYGFEACFHPMSYDWLAENWPEDLLGKLRQAGAQPHESCGMHVHTSRSGFSDPVHAYKWIKFMYRNAQHMRRMARRDPGQWGSFDRPEERRVAKWHAKGGYGSQNRYSAINCQPEKTYEVRIFASTLNHTRFMGSLGLVDASIEYTRQLTTQDILAGNGWQTQTDVPGKGWQFDPFREYVHSFKKYRPLQLEMARILDK